MEIESLTMDAEEQSLRDLALETDRIEDRPIKSEPSAEKSPESRASEQAKPAEPRPSDVEVPEKEPSSSDLASDIRKRERDEKSGQFKPKEVKPEEKTAPEKPETQYSRAQKEEIRKERTWQDINAKREELERDKAAWQEQARMAQLQAARAQNQPIKKDGLTAQEYYEGFKRFKEAGDYENATAALEVALELNNSEQVRMRQQQEIQNEYQWRTDMDSVAKQRPDLVKPDSPVLQRLASIIEANPWVYDRVPHGFLIATEIAEILVRDDERSELLAENIELRAFKEKTLAGSQPAKGGAIRGGRAGEKSFDDMDLEEMEEHLKRTTQEADSYR